MTWLIDIATDMVTFLNLELLPFSLKDFSCPKFLRLLVDVFVYVKETLISINSATQKEFISLDILQETFSKLKTSLITTVFNVQNDTEHASKHVRSDVEYVKNRGPWNSQLLLHFTKLPSRISHKVIWDL